MDISDCHRMLDTGLCMVDSRNVLNLPKIKLARTSSFGSLVCPKVDHEATSRHLYPPHILFKGVEDLSVTIFE